MSNSFHNPITPIPSPALSFIGRKNSGKTTLLEKLIGVLSKRGLSIASVKHHGHPEFDIDIPGRDSYRHRMAGARSATILSDTRFAQVVELSQPLSCESVIEQLSGFDLVLVEGFRESNIDHIELFRANNPRDVQVASKYINFWKESPENRPVATVTDIQEISTFAQELNIPVFSFDEVMSLADFIQERFARPPLSVVIQAEGEPRRMNTPKELLDFLGKPLITYTLDRVAPIANELIVTTNNPEQLQFLAKDYPHLKLQKDPLSIRGALPRIYTALTAAKHDLTSIVACNMIDIPTALIAHEALLLRTGSHPSFDVVFPKTEKGIEPFSAVYKTDPCLAVLQETMAASIQDMRVHDFLTQLHYATVDCSHPRKCAQYGGSFLGINTPEDAARAEKAFTKDSSCIR